MKYAFIACLILFSFFLLSCSECEEVFYGFISIDSDPQGVPIIIDERTTEYITPVILEKKIGSYMVSVCFDDTLFSTQPVTVLDSDTVQLFFSSVDSGTVLISSDPQGALVYINGETTEYYTPVELRLPIGAVEFSLLCQHYLRADSTITIAKNADIELNFGLLIPRRYVFLEEFSNIRCMPCVNVYNAVHEILPSYGEDVVFLEIHTNLFPMDPFHDENAIVHDTRTGFYEITTIPRLFYDGISFSAESRTDPVAIANTIDQRLNDVPQLVISGYYEEIINNTYSVTVYTDAKNGLSVSDLKMYGFIFRDTYVFDVLPTGSNGISEFHNVLFDMFTEVGGFSMDILPMSVDTFNFEFDLPDTIDIGNIGLSVVVQNIVSKEVVQASYIDLK